MFKVITVLDCLSPSENDFTTSPPDRTLSAEGGRRDEDRGTHRDTQISGQTEGHTDKWTDRGTHRRADRQRDTQTSGHTE